MTIQEYILLRHLGQLAGDDPIIRWPFAIGLAIPIPLIEDIAGMRATCLALVG
jgi:hypothetical protein